MNDENNVTYPYVSMLTHAPLVSNDSLIDWDELFDPVGVVDPNALVPSVSSNHRWVTAIQKVSPKSGAFWFDYGKRYGEKVMMKILSERDPKGRRCCDVMIFTQRSVGDVVYSAWTEYNQWLADHI